MVYELPQSPSYQPRPQQQMSGYRAAADEKIDQVPVMSNFDLTASEQLAESSTVPHPVDPSTSKTDQENNQEETDDDFYWNFEGGSDSPAPGNLPLGTEYP